MIKKYGKRGLISGLSACMALLGACLSTWGLAPVDKKEEAVYEHSAQIVARNMPRVHLTHLPCGDDIATNALYGFLSALDYNHSYFLASDIDAFERQATDLDDELRKGNLDFAFHVYDVLMQRMSNRVDYVDSLLDKGFDLTRDESYTWKRKDAPWPKDQAEWNDIWRQRIKSEYISRLVAKQLDEEEKAAKAAEDVAHTNQTDEVKAEGIEEAAAAGETNKLEKAAADEPVAAKPPLMPKEAIRKEYRQILSVLNDNDLHWLLTLYLSSFTRAYDPHSAYMSAHNIEDFDIQMKLSLVGIGALLSTDEGAAKVVRLIPGGPAERDGQLKAGDKIIAVAQGDEEPVDIMHWPLSKSVRLIRGKKGTTVVLTVIPASDPSGATTRRIRIVRDEVKLEEQAAKGEVKKVEDERGVEHTLGVITIPEFYADVRGRGRDKDARSVTHDVRRILKELQTNDIEGVILDLRGNGGGLLSEGVELTGLFIDRGPVVMVKSDAGIQVLRDPDPREVYSGPLIVLVNRLSASASEILTGALKDYGRAVVVGDSKTHGKGTVQSLIGLDRHNKKYGSLKTTTASFYRISGGSTQLEGVTPHITIPSILDYMEIGEDHLPNALPWDMQSPVYYERAEVPRVYLPKLRVMSEKRRRDDPQFQVYRKLLDYLGERRKSEKISLRLDDRLEEARREREMSKLMQDMDPTREDVTDKEKKEAQDLILDETLNILTDLIDLEREHSPHPAAAGHPRHGENG